MLHLFFQTMLHGNIGITVPLREAVSHRFDRNRIVVNEQLVANDHYLPHAKRLVQCFVSSDRDSSLVDLIYHPMLMQQCGIGQQIGR